MIYMYRKTLFAFSHLNKLMFHNFFRLLATRPKDDSRKGFKSWTFMSVETWGENPKGIFKKIFRYA